MSECPNSAALVATPAMKEFTGRVFKRLRDVDDRYMLINTEITRFAVGELKPVIKDSVRNRKVYLFHSMFYPDVNTSFVELLLTGDALETSHAASIAYVLPFISYTRQDKKDKKERAPLSARAFAKAIETNSKLNHIITMDLHAPQIEGFYRTAQVDDLPGARVFGRYFRQELKSGYGDIVFASLEDGLSLVSPDVGGLKRVKELRKQLDERIGVGAIDKDRIGTNEINLGSYIGPDVKDKLVIMVDDLIDTGDSTAKGGQLMYELGAKKVVAAATFGLFSEKDGIPAGQRLKDAGIDVVITEAIPRPATFYQENVSWLRPPLPLDEFYAHAIAQSEMVGGSMHRVFKD